MIKTKQFSNSVQKQVGLLISFIGISMVVLNFSYRLAQGDILYALSGLTVWALLLITMPFIISVFIEGNSLKIAQIFGFFITGVLNIMDNYQEFYGPALFLVAWLLLRQYGFLDRHKKIKNVLIFISFMGVSQTAAILNNEGAYAGMSTLLYTLFLVAMLLIIWRDMIKQQAALEKENLELQINYKKISAQVNLIETEHKPYDLKTVGISAAETRVIEVLTLYKASNKEIAERLFLAESTIKLHLYNIYQKMGVDNRFAVIDLCKYNFTEKGASQSVGGE